ncbi:L-arabinose isomerase [Phycisphaera mikurensis]|uniref:L-arabinose isomerase n=1 Tax=Phycisphaera mikurensis (strain NBRC 102666 / KCTC 22515 / FYK2301M01) TaxID=1142394 RepID=I0IIQ8_PHYMF|nr:L-arabinose isomerase [Phycisphaera mikurensis]MBB6442703.1 L-arabinose isomerase [Phycisphaera mikurensis]BAM05146.1 L-arabinose isomerase [Phycisphaera mikurensis NBRC 102666]
MSTIDTTASEIWFLTGSQHLYGEETLAEVAADAREVAAGLDAAESVPIRVVHKPTLTTAEEVTATLAAADADAACIGLIAWMHTFSPAKMWIAGLSRLRKPLLHLHTQHHRALPWPTIDMDFMNLHQSAHGGREFGHLCTRIGLRRKVVVGPWQDDRVRASVGAWCRAASAWADQQGARFARFGDNMREVSVTEGDKVEAQLKLGYAVHGYGLGELAERVDAAGDAAVDGLVAAYLDAYDVDAALRPGGERAQSLRDAAAIEIGIRGFLEDGGFRGYTNTFENLHGLRQLPGIASQRLMADGYGFGAEGDWKHAALVRAVKVMGHGLPGGTSFMEDYTYDFSGAGGGKVLGAHMLEICPSIAAGRPRCEAHPLGIGGKDDPVRLVFDAAAGEATNASMVDMGDRFRLVVNTVTCEPPAEPLPRLPVARALWTPHPDLPAAARAWILAGGAHHTAFSLAVTPEMLDDYARIAGVERILIGRDGVDERAATAMR